MKGIPMMTAKLGYVKEVDEDEARFLRGLCHKDENAAKRHREVLIFVSGGKAA